MVMVPLLVMFPAKFGLARMPVEPFAPVIVIAPSLVTPLLLSMVTAAPPVGLTDPVEVMRISPDTLVVSGVVTAVVIVVSAAAGAAIITASAPRPVEVSRKRIVNPFGLDGRGTALRLARAFASRTASSRRAGESDGEE